MKLRIHVGTEKTGSSYPGYEPLPTPRQSIRLENITYTYPNAKRPTLSQLNISIAAQTTVGFVGKSGSGKTTAVDIILGLLKPEAGHVRVDDVVITAENYGMWQKTLGYVPQHIFLSDDSILAARSTACRSILFFGTPKPMFAAIGSAQA